MIHKIMKYWYYLIPFVLFGFYLLIDSIRGASVVASGSSGSDVSSPVDTLYYNNPFNLISTGIQWKGKITPVGSSFEHFNTLDMGLRAGLINLRNGYFRKGIDCASCIVEKYAPVGSGIHGNSPQSVENYKYFLLQGTGIQSINHSLAGFELQVAYNIISFEQGYPAVSYAKLQEVNNLYKIF